MDPKAKGPRYDDEHNVPPSFAMRVHDELTDDEEQKIRDARSRGMAPTGDPSTDAREAARKRIRERHGHPGHGLHVPQEVIEEKCSGEICSQIARDDDGNKRIGRGGSMIVADCDTCTRSTNAFALVDLRDVGDPVRTVLTEKNIGIDHPPGVMPDHCCSGCWSRWIREGWFTKSEWMEAHGAPPQLVERVRGTFNDTSP